MMINTILLVCAYLFTQMCIVWFLYRLTKNPSIVDVSWPFGLMVSGLIYLFSGTINFRVIIISIALTLWALRLAGYLLISRICKGHVDKRYTELSEQWKVNKSFGFFINFQLQALMILIISTIFLFISMSDSTSLSKIDITALFIILIGIVCETIADWQLNHFKNTHPGLVCNIGWWRYSRHPNYFFDWLTWLGFTIFAVQSGLGFLSIFSLIFLYIIFNYITGPITEQGSIKSRGQQYIAYQQETSMFFPWFKKKG